MLKPVMTNPWVQAAGAVVALALLCLLCYALTPVLVPLLFAFLAAYVLDPVVDFFEARRVPRSATIAVLAVLGVVLLLAIPVFLIPNLITQADHLINAGSEGVRSGALAKWVDPLLKRLPLDDLVRYLGWAAPEELNVDPIAVIAAHIGTYVKENALQILRNYAPHMADMGQWAGETAAQILASIGRNVIKFILFLGNLALFVLVAGYLLNDFDRLIAAAKELVPPKYRAHTFSIVSKIDLQVHSFLRGQLFVCACLGMMYMVGLFISGVPFAIPIGFFGGAASFVPYLGVSLTILPSLLLVVLQHGLDWHLVGVLATFGIAQFLEGMVLTPKIIGNQVGLSPVWVILAIMVFSSLLGFVGLLLAVPMAAALKVLVIESVAYYKKSPVFESDGGSAGKTG